MTPGCVDTVIAFGFGFEQSTVWWQRQETVKGGCGQALVLLTQAGCVATALALDAMSVRELGHDTDRPTPLPHPSLVHKRVSNLRAPGKAGLCHVVSISEC
jgi:hypothetical protein